MKKKLIAIITLAVIVLILAVLLLGRDISSPDTSDLAVSVLSVPDKENAFTYFNEAAKTLFWPADDALASDILNGKAKAEGDYVRDIILKNQETIRLIKEGNKFRICQAPEVTGFDTLMPYLSAWRKIARVMTLKAIYERENGDYSGSIETCMEVLKFGNLILEYPEALIGYLVGMSIMDTGLEQLRKLVCINSVTYDELIKTAGELKEFGPYNNGFIRSVKVEYRMVDDIIDNISSGKQNIEELVASPLPDEKVNWRLFQPNRTKKLFADFFRRAIKEAPKPYYEIDAAYFKDVKYAADKRPWMFDRNAVGKFLIALIIPAYDKCFELKSRMDVSLSATRFMFLCKAYEKKIGRLPDSLEELVPEYADSIPIDPFDGKPLKYSADEKVIYSVGSDRQGSSELAYKFED
ncbi:MAG: hypothetical protein JW728_00345 [Candidatus Aureabacteria bacterium]|nr:hypothetical protein [Candidatus Auribacterota bacterium]